MTPTFQLYSSICFFQINSTGPHLNVTGNGNTVTMVGDNATVNEGNNYDTTTYTFTAPFTGNYEFVVTLTMNSNTPSNSIFYTYTLVTTAANYTVTAQLQGNGGTFISFGDNYPAFSWGIHMDSGDTAFQTLSMSNGPANSCGYLGVNFQGYLIGT